MRIDNFSIGYEAATWNSKVISFVGRVICSQATNDVVIFLRGGTKYYYGNADLIANTGSYQDGAGQSFSTVSIHDPLYNLPKGSYVGSFDINAKTSNFAVVDNGNVGIGVSNPLNKLDVNGLIHAKEVKVDLQNWPDYVFKKEYGLMPLAEVEKFIKENGHLSNIPSASEVEKDGVKLGEMNAKFLEKIEELTLYVIQLNKELKQLREENKKFEANMQSISK